MFQKKPVSIDEINGIKSAMCCTKLNRPLIHRSFRSKATNRLLPSCLAGICYKGSNDVENGILEELVRNYSHDFAGLPGKIKLIMQIH